jgi:hypothetical protein
MAKSLMTEYEGSLNQSTSSVSDLGTALMKHLEGKRLEERKTIIRAFKLYE